MGRKGKLIDAYIPTDGTDPKPRILPEILVLAIVILTGTGGFGLGYLMGKEAGSGADRGLRIENIPSGEELSAVTANAVLAGEVKSASVEIITKTPTAVIPVPPGGVYVASKNGEAYYLPSCGGAKNIKEENRIWFASKAEATQAGYRPAKTCKGI